MSTIDDLSRPSKGLNTGKPPANSTAPRLPNVWLETCPRFSPVSKALALTSEAWRDAMALKRRLR